MEKYHITAAKKMADAVDRALQNFAYLKAL